MNRLLLTLALSAAIGLPAATEASARNVLDIKESITDSAIVFPESFEQNTQRMLEGWYLKNYTTTDDRYARAKDVTVSDDELRKRLSQLPTLLDMPFNQVVKTYINNYTSKSRSQVAALLGLSNYYMPIFEQALEAAGLPQELKYVPVIESALDPNAVSSSGAAGLWQLMVTPAKAIGLEVNSVVDERRDPYLSTEKAVQLLKDLHESYGDWYLAIAAYNCGPGTVNKALRRAGGDPKKHDFWSIYKFLPEQTRGYVPKFIAANYVMNYYDKHNISPVLATKPLVTDTVAVKNRLHFNQVSEVLNIPVEELRILNPQFRADIIPASDEHPYYLILPSQQVYAYIVSEEAILAHDAEKYARRVDAEPGEAAPALASTEQPAEETSQADREMAEQITEVRNTAAAARNGNNSGKTITHKVGQGETISTIATNYGVKVSDIREWNNLRRNAVRTGQQLVIYTDRTPAATQPSAQPKTAQAKAAQPKEDNTQVATPRSKKGKKEQAVAAHQEPQPAQVKAGKKGKKGKQAETATTKSSKKSKKQKKQQVQPTSHTVKSGESLERIARSNGVTVEQLRKANPKLKGDMIHPGDKVNLPKQKSSKSTKKSRKKKK